MTAASTTYVLIGLMGAGKTSIGRKLAERLKLPFIDADDEIIEAAGCSIADIFEVYGEPAFRDVEERVIARLLGDKHCVLATGGGAFMNPNTRANIARHGLSIWLKADLDVLVGRTARRRGRPLLDKGEPRRILADLMAQRHPVYANADITVETGSESIDETLHALMEAIAAHSGAGAEARAR